VYVPPSIANAVLPSWLSMYDSVASYLYRYAAIASQHRNHPWCRDASYNIFMNLKTDRDDVYLLSRDIHTVVKYCDIIIDVECNSFIYNFDWLTEVNPQEHTRINPDIDTSSVRAKIQHYFSTCATQKFILRGEII